MGRARLLVSDFIISFMWVWSGVLIKLFVFRYVGLSHQPLVEVLRLTLSTINMFFFALLGNWTHGGAYNPLTVLAGAFSGDFSNFLFCVGARIPAQVFGSITGVRFIIATIPEVGRGPRLSIDIHRGAWTEGLLTFAIVIISLGLSLKLPGSFYRKTWISSISKLTLSILGSDLTGGVMNPASVMGWAYNRGDHITKEHILVYWLAPVKATLLAMWVFKLLVKPATQDKTSTKTKSD
ncbi:hypothetical protein K1719_027164 [Acacia pycnantha]|nr:hypothetical protein K1719_046706 [Acacia pycnantha]KAI9093715.1 hypothetical protein K1719_027164 [Acacia pycnantha]